MQCLTRHDKVLRRICFRPHAEWLIRFLLLAAMLILLAGCAGHVSTHYDINYLRADKDTLAIHYRKETYVGVASLLNVHGSTLWDSRSCFHKQLAKADLKDGDEIDLLRGGSKEISCGNYLRSDSVLYQDADFRVEDYHGFFSQSRYSDEAYEAWATVTTRGVESTIKCPPLPKLYERSKLYPLRVEDKLIVCGKLISIGGKPEDGNPSLFEHRYEPGMVRDGAIYFLELYRGDPFRKKGPIEFAKLDAHSFQPTGKATLDLDWEDARIYGRYGGSFLFLIEKRPADKLAYACLGERCRKFVLKGFSSFADALMLEDSGDELLVLLKEEGSATVYRVKHIKAEAE